MLFWDFDTQWGVDRYSNPRARIPNRGLLDFVNTERLLELHAEYGIPACFAVVGAAALPGARPYHDPELIRRIHQAGHEVASHSFQHDWLPGLGRVALRQTLSRSKDALEQCIGAPIVSFVPPYNRPGDYPPGWAFSLLERRAGHQDRTNLTRLCETLAECVYRFSRISYRSLFRKLLILAGKRNWEVPVEPQHISGITCLRLNTPDDFGNQTHRMVQLCAERGGFAVVYGHPLNLGSPDSQAEAHLVELLKRVNQLRRGNQLTLLQPRDLVGNGQKTKPIPGCSSRVPSPQHE